MPEGLCIAYLAEGFDRSRDQRAYYTYVLGAGTEGDSMAVLRFY